MIKMKYNGRFGLKHYTVRPLLLLLCLALSARIPAQLPSDFRTEQVALALSDYTPMPGDTLLVEGQATCQAADRFLPYSNYVYVECVSSSDSVLCRHKVSCKDGGHFALWLPVDYDWAAGTYYLRAYTRLMMNFSSESFCEQPFLVGRKLGMREDDARDLRCAMSVVGGRLIGGCMQRVAICVTNDFGFPVSVKLDVKDDKGSVVASLTTSQAGLAMLNFIPKVGSRYVLITHDGASTFALPDVSDGGLQLLGDINGSRIRYQINGDTIGAGYQLCTYDRLNGLQQYAIAGKKAGMLQLPESPEVASLFLLDADGEVVAESTLASPRSIGGLQVSVKDTVRVGEALRFSIPQMGGEARVMARLVADNVPAVPMEAALKYLADYRSSLPFPSDSYLRGNNQRREDLYTWLCSARFKRFDVAKALRDKEQMYRYMPEDNMTFGGTVNFANGKPLDGGSLLAFNTETNNVYEADIDTQGRFRMAVDDFDEGTNFYIEAKSAKGKEDFYKYQLDNDSFPSVRDIALRQTTVWQQATTVDTKKGVTPGFNDGRYFTLPNIDVKARVQSPYNTPTEKFYSNNYIDREEIEKKDYHTLRDILGRMPNLEVLRAINEQTGEVYWVVKSRRGMSSFRHVSDSNVKLLIDGALVEGHEEVNNLMETDAFEIESVELLQAWQSNAMVPGAINGCVSVKTRSYSEKKQEVKPKGVYYSPIGLALQTGNADVRTDMVATRSGNMRLCVDVVDGASVRSIVVPVRVEN